MTQEPKAVRICYIFPDDNGGAHPLHEVFPLAMVDYRLISEFAPGLVVEPMYDIVYCSMALPLVEGKDVPATIKNLTAALADRGELWLITPSLDWAALTALSDNPHPAVHSAIYGPADNPYRSGFMLAWLRQLVEDQGLIPRKVFQGRYTVALAGQSVEIPNNVVIAWKV